MDTPTAISQRLTLARQLLDADVERALQFADPVLATVTTDGLDFLSSLRDKDAAAADQRYAAMLGNAAANIQSDANTVALLSAYLFTPHMYVTLVAAGLRLCQGSRAARRQTWRPNCAPCSFARALTFCCDLWRLLARIRAHPASKENTWLSNA